MHAFRAWAGLALLMAGTAVSLQAQPGPAVIEVNAARPGAAIAPTMYGVFFEDINFGADGGLYPERVKNRSFEFNEPLAGWTGLLFGKATGELDVRTDQPLNQHNPHYLRMRAYEPG